MFYEFNLVQKVRISFEQAFFLNRMVSSSIYIARKTAQKFADDFKQALRYPEESSLLYHVYGIGGVGKSTLLQNVRDTYKEKVLFATATFDVSSLVDDPLSLMNHLYSQLPVDDWGDETFTARYKLFKDTFRLLETEPAKGRGKGRVDSEQVALVRKVVGGAVKAIASFKFSEETADNAKNAAESAVDVAALAVSEKDKLEQLLKKHWATKRDKELQALMADPLPRLTRLFTASLIQKASSKPIVIMLDTYEKASSEFDAFLCQYLVGNMLDRRHAVRIITAGRYSIKKKKYQRMFQSHGEMVCEYRLEKFDKSETKEYLNQAGIKDTDLIRRIFTTTKGFPYYLKLFKDQAGEHISFSSGRDEIANRLLSGLDDTEKKVVQLIAYCRYFDRAIVRYILEEKNTDVGEDVAQSRNWFEWLKERDFVVEGEHYRLDDVARDVIRASLCRDDERNFRQTHKLFANYFRQLASDAVSPDRPVPEKYENSEWRKHTTEVIYHSLFANRNEGQHNLLTYFFEGAHFDIPEISRDAFTAVASEANLEDNPLLPTDTKKLLSGIGPAIAFGWEVLGEPPSSYEFKIQIGGHNETKNATDIKEQVENALRKCSQKSQSLSGLARYVQLTSSAIRCPSSNKRKRILEQAEEVAQDLISVDHSDFSSQIFCSIGHGFDSIKAFDKALTSFKTAADINPENYEALVNQGNMLSSLGKYEEALSAYDAAMEVDPEYFATWNNKGNAFLGMKRYEEALIYLTKAVEIAPEEALCCANKGRALGGMERYEKALSMFIKATDLHSNGIEEYGIEVTTTLRLLGRYREAFSYCNQVLEIDNDNLDAWNSRGLCLSLLHSHDEAIYSLNKAVKLDKSERNASLANKGIAVARSGDCKSGLALCKEYLQKTEDEYGYYAQACCYVLQGNNELAIQSLGRAIEFEPNLCKREARANPDFAPLQKNEEFQTLVAL